MDLYEWTEEYIRFRDVIRKKIVDIKKQNRSILVKEKEKENPYLIEEDLLEGINKLSDFEKKKSIIIVTLNKEKNLDVLIKNWDNLLEFEDLTVLFSHPGTNEKWSVHLKSHDKISEKKHLKEGLKILFESITTIN